MRRRGDKPLSVILFCSYAPIFVSRRRNRANQRALHRENALLLLPTSPVSTASDVQKCTAGTGHAPEGFLLAIIPKSLFLAPGMAMAKAGAPRSGTGTAPFELELELSFALTWKGGRLLRLGLLRLLLCLSLGAARPALPQQGIFDAAAPLLLAFGIVVEVEDLGFPMSRTAGSLNVALGTAEEVVTHHIATVWHIQTFLQGCSGHQDSAGAAEPLQILQTKTFLHALNTTHLETQETKLISIELSLTRQDKTGRGAWAISTPVDASRSRAMGPATDTRSTKTKILSVEPDRRRLRSLHSASNFPLASSLTVLTLLARTSRQRGSSTRALCKHSTESPSAKANLLESFAFVEAWEMLQ